MRGHLRTTKKLHSACEHGRNRRFENAILRVLDEEVLCEEGLVRLAAALRDEVAARKATKAADVPANLKKREKELEQQITNGARRLLQVDDNPVPDLRNALAELMAELERVRRSIEHDDRANRDEVSADEMVQRTMSTLRSMAAALHDRSVPLDRRREVLRRLLPMRDGKRPITFDFDFSAGRGWRRALRRVTVRHLSVRRRLSTKMVAGAVAAEAGQPDATAWDPVAALVTWERELGMAALEEAALVGTRRRRSREPRASALSRRARVWEGLRGGDARFAASRARAPLRQASPAS